MKKIFLLFIIPLIVLSQDVTSEIIVHNNLERSYILYIPANYNGVSPVPLVLNLHGYGSNAGQQMIYTNFYEVADNEGFILIHPEGTTNNQGSQFWNSGNQFWDINNIDDVSFIGNLIDTITSQYNVNTDRIYSMGMSNGGFMSYRLSCELSDKIAAIASVTGSMSQDQIQSCSPERPIPIMQIHGTSDPIVAYSGNDLFGFAAIESTLSYWVTFNDCNTEPVFNALPNINTMDLCTAEHYVYNNGTNDSSVEFYKIINGGHTWPGAVIQLFEKNTNQDFNASEKIWEFFNKYDINGLINNNVNTFEEKIEKKKLRSINLLGQEATNEFIQIDIYNNGTAKKKYFIK